MQRAVVDLCDFKNQEIILDTVLRMKKQHFLSCPLSALCFNPLAKSPSRQTFITPDLRTSLLKMKFLTFGVLGYPRGLSQGAIPEGLVSWVGYGTRGAGGSVL